MAAGQPEKPTLRLFSQRLKEAVFEPHRLCTPLNSVVTANVLASPEPCSLQYSRMGHAVTRPSRLIKVLIGPPHVPKVVDTWPDSAR